MIGSNDCGTGCVWCDGSCQWFGVPIPKEKPVEKNETMFFRTEEGAEEFERATEGLKEAERNMLWPNNEDKK